MISAFPNRRAMAAAAADFPLAVTPTMARALGTPRWEATVSGKPLRAPLPESWCATGAAR